MCIRDSSYAVKNEVYDKIISSFDGSDPIDVCFSKIQSSINCYVIRPHLAWQRPSHSDVRGFFTDTPFLYNDNEFFEGRYYGPEMLKRDDIRDKLEPWEREIYDRQKRTQT